MRMSDEQRFDTLKASVAELGYFRRGTVLRRFRQCGKPSCRCQATPPELHGPYYQWTRKVKGKTVTVQLTEEQARVLQGWIANGRHLERIVKEMEDVSHRLTERLLQAARRPSSEP